MSRVPFHVRSRHFPQKEPSGCEVGALHGVESVDGVSHARLQRAHVGGSHEAVAQAGQGSVAVDVMQDGITSCQGDKTVLLGCCIQSDQSLPPEPCPRPPEHDPLINHGAGTFLDSVCHEK